MNALRDTVSVIFPHLSNKTNYYKLTSTSITPKDNFPITVNADGNTVSIYGDDIWDMSSYLQNTSINKKMNFEKIKNKQLISESKLLMFYVMVYGRSKKGGLYSASYLQTNYFNEALYPLAVFALANKISIRDVLSNENQLKKYINDFVDNKPRLIRPLSNIMDIIDRVDDLKHYRLLDHKKIEGNIQKYKQKLLLQESHNSTQTAVIPTEIFNNCLLERWQHVEHFEQHLKNICKFIKKLVSNEFYGIEGMIDYTIKESDGSIINAIAWDNFFYKRHKLQSFHRKYNKSYYSGRMEFRNLILDFQGTCKHLIHAYSGMRSDEAMSLKSNCIENYKDGNNVKVTKLIGVTTKLEGQAKTVKWVTSDKTERIVKILDTINRAVYHNQNIDYDKLPLFAPTAPIHKPIDHRDITGKSSIVTNNRELYLSKKAATIKEEDILELEAIDYFRDWRNENDFAIGREWKFKSHQYRRSLAVYSIQSGLVSLGGLQIQLKHLFKEMTLYYGKGSSHADKLFKTNGLSKEIKKMKPEMEALAYIKNVIFSDEDLYGNYGKNVTTKTKEVFIATDRKKLVDKFQKGEINYKETALGGCTTLEACDSSLTRSITACLDCKDGILKKSKLLNTIEKQKEFVDFLDKDSIEYKSEIKDLETLESYANKLERGNNE